jgi:dolichol kinase
VRRPAEPARKSIHLALGLLPFLAWWGMGTWPGLTRVVLVAVALFAVALDRLRLVNPAWDRFIHRLVGPLLRDAERHGLLGSTLMVVSLALVFVVLPPALALAAMLFLVTGDGAAALVGGRFGRHRLFGRATLEGTIACLAATLAVVPVMRWIDPRLATGVLLVGAAAATLAETLVPGKWDNAAIPVLSGAAMRAMTAGH